MQNEADQSPQPPQDNPGQMTTPAAPAPPEAAVATVPEKGLHNYIISILATCVILGIFLPPSEFAQMLAWPIVIFGVIVAVKFVVDAIKSAVHRTVLAKIFITVFSLGIGFVIFMACVITALIIGFTKDPHPQSTG